MKRKHWTKPSDPALLSPEWIKAIKEALESPGFIIKPPILLEIDSYEVSTDEKYSNGKYSRTNKTKWLNASEKKNFKTYLNLIKESQNEV